MLIKSQGDDHSHTVHVQEMSRNNAGSQIAISVELREPVAGWIYVVCFKFGRHRLVFNKKLATS